MSGPHGLKVERFGPTAWSLEPEVLPSGAIERAHVLASVAAKLGDACDPVVGSRSVLVVGAAPSRELPDAAQASSLSPRVESGPHVIPVVYDGPDLSAVAAATGLSVDAVIERHLSVEYTAVLCGFLPGFAYLAETSPELRVSRKSAPRSKVTARSVGIAGPYTGIYPSASPGGWNLLGEAMTGDLFDPTRSQPPLVNLLDRVRFARVDRLAALSGAPSDVDRASTEQQTTEEARVTITRLSGLGTLVDRGRPSHRRFGVPLGGPLDRESYEELRATCGVETVLELMAGAVELTVTHGSTWLASNGEPARLLKQGESIRFEARAALTRLIALGGEPRVAPVLGSRSTILGFTWAGQLGRPLVKGDTLSIELAVAMPMSVSRAIDVGEGDVILDFEPNAERSPALVGIRLEVGATSSRVGTRLHGSSVMSDPAASPSTGESNPMVPGAVQQTPDGTLIVLGPDSATLGGYPIVGFLTEQARSALARLRPGRAVRLGLI